MNQPWYVKEALNYHKDRYMSHLSDDDLFKRSKDVIINCIEINNNGKIAADLSDDYGQFFWVRWTHIIEEYKIRFGDFRKVFDKQNINGLNIPKNFPLIDQACIKINGIVNDNLKPRIYKYGKKIYFEKVLDEGKIRISPASFYNDPSLNHAINDDELSFTSQNHPSDLKMEAFDKLGNFKGQIKPLESKLTFKSTTNYYVFCLSNILSPRLFVDFDADSCIIIKNVSSFLKKLIEGFFKVKKGYYGSIGIVQYLDPIFTYYKEYDAFYSKHFRYAYQREFRICFIPFEDIIELNPIELNIGSLEDCCEAINIEDT